MYKVTFKNSLYGQYIYCNNFVCTACDNVLVQYDFKEVLFYKFYGTPNIKHCGNVLGPCDKYITKTELWQLNDHFSASIYSLNDPDYEKQYKLTKVERFEYFENRYNGNLISIEKILDLNYEDYKFQHEYEFENLELRKKLELEVSENNKKLELEIEEIKSKHSTCNKTQIKTKPWWKFWE